MENKYVCIQLKDINYYDDDFEYEPIIVEKDENFEETFNELKKVCKNYEDFNEVDEFIEENFKKINIEKRIIKI